MLSALTCEVQHGLTARSWGWAALLVWQGDGRRGPVLRLTRNFQSAPLETDQPAGVGQAHAALAAGGLGREERAGSSLAHFLWQTGSLLSIHTRACVMLCVERS
jgi:hypothetical protein